MGVCGMSEDAIETKRGWVHRFRKSCPHCGLPIALEVYIPMLPPKPSFSLKGAVKARTKITIDLPSVPPPNPDDDEANR